MLPRAGSVIMKVLNIKFKLLALLINLTTLSILKVLIIVTTPFRSIF